MKWIQELGRIGGDGAAQMAQIGLSSFLVLIVISAVSAFFIAFLYKQFYGSRATGSQVHRSFPLLGIAITTIFITIQFSLPLSLGLLGALSIVRFRTPIKEPEEIGFILLVIAVSICCATANIPFLLILLAVSLGALLVIAVKPGLLQGRYQPGILMLDLPQSTATGVAPEALIQIINRHIRAKVKSITDDGDGVTVTVFFQKYDPESFGPMKQELRDAAKQVKMSVFFNQLAP